jgi:hypothetical protein
VGRGRIELPTFRFTDGALLGSSGSGRRKACLVGHRVSATGHAGRRAVLVGGPDVWEVIAAARGERQRGDRLVRAVAQGAGITEDKVRIAIRYYAEYPDEVDRLIDRNESEGEELRRTLEREQRLLG